MMPGDLESRLTDPELAAIFLIVVVLSTVASVVVYQIWKTHRMRNGAGYREVELRENTFEMMALGGREGVEGVVLPQGY